MCNKNVISKKFDLKLVTTFSSYWCTAIFAKSRSLHYVLKKQRKLISMKNTEEQRFRKEMTHRNPTSKPEGKTTLKKLTDHSKNLTTRKSTSEQRY
jgi:hypothetical protein